MALMSAVATLFAALFVCLAPHGGAEGPDRDRYRDHGRGMTLAVAAAEAVASEYTCPYDRGDCGLFPSLTPAVLTAPPLDPPPQPDAVVRMASHPAAGRPAASEARPRAPDLHVLQVLRT
ncbi:hypothetical protein [Streptomyces sp. CB03238]|uniref:hypothetical protein n=1 Tax=Streptomyces sp. CB03238 TaxID=1907777 RepID=UPI000A11749E|nr:hypothetical protein [Streptomyces sp. CB03238]ORT60378.1 hypothetical protein BKD26_08315 [Streptomyces sp. CB03238]